MPCEWEDKVKFPLAEYLKSKSCRAKRGTRLLPPVCKNPFIVSTSRWSVFPGPVDRDLLVFFPNFIHVACASSTRRGGKFS